MQGRSHAPSSRRSKRSSNSLFSKKKARASRPGLRIPFDRERDQKSMSPPKSGLPDFGTLKMQVRTGLRQKSMSPPKSGLPDFGTLKMQGRTGLRQKSMSPPKSGLPDFGTLKMQGRTGLRQKSMSPMPP